VMVTEYRQLRLRSPGAFHAPEGITSEPAYLLQQLTLGRFGDTHDDFGVFGQVEESEVFLYIDDDMVAVGKHLVLECASGHPIEFWPVFPQQLHLQERVGESDKDNLIGDKIEVG